jgi:hypothetical protein
MAIAKPGRQDQDFFHNLTLPQTCDNEVTAMLNSVHICTAPFETCQDGGNG